MEATSVFRTNRLPWSAVLIVCASVLIGLLASYPFPLAAAFSLLLITTLGVGGEVWLLASIVLPLGLSFSFLTDAGLSGAENIDGLRLVLALGGFAVVAFRRPSLLAPLRETSLYLVFLAFGALSLIWTSSQADGARLWLKLSYPLVSFVVGCAVLRNNGRELINNFIRVAALLSVFLNVSVAVLGLSPYSGVGYAVRFGGASHPNTVGLFSAAIALILYTFWSVTHKRVDLMLSVLMVMQLVATGSRTALLAGLIGFVSLELLQGRFRRIVGVVLLGACVWIVVPTFGARTLDPAGGSVAPEVGAPAGVNLSGRMTLWMDVWSSLMGDSQLLGRGLGTTESFFTARYASLRSVHNGYIQLLIDTGFMGAGLVLGFFGTVIVRLIPLALRKEPQSAFSALAIGSILMFLLSSFTEGTFGGYAYPAIVWLTLSLATARTFAPGTLGRVRS